MRPYLNISLAKAPVRLGDQAAQTPEGRPWAPVRPLPPQRPPSPAVNRRPSSAAGQG